MYIKNELYQHNCYPNEMIVGFTGSRDGLTIEARQVLEYYISNLNITEFHHGDCVGADRTAHQIAWDKNIFTVIHPPKNDKYRAFCLGDVCLPEKDYLIRNKDIVRSCQLLLACPSSKTEVLRSGTWSTIRHAIKLKIKVIVIYPDGSVTEM